MTTKIFLLYNTEDITFFNHPDIIPLKLRQTEYFESEAFRMLYESHLPNVENIGFITPSSRYKIPNFSIQKLLEIEPNPITFLSHIEKLCENQAVESHGHIFLNIWRYVLKSHSIPESIMNTYTIKNSNLWIAKKSFVIEYLTFAKNTIKYLENAPLEIRKLLFSDSKYRGKLLQTNVLIERFGHNYYPFHPFVMERLICLFDRIKNPASQLERGVIIDMKKKQLNTTNFFLKQPRKMN